MTYETHKATLVARYDAQVDGQPVEIYCTATPARFYTLKALAGKNSVGKPIAPFDLRTGSGSEMAQLVEQMGKAIAGGMLGLNAAGEVRRNAVTSTGLLGLPGSGDK